MGRPVERPVPYTVDGGKDGTVDGGRWEGRYRRRWPVERPVPSTGTVGGGIFPAFAIVYHKTLRVFSDKVLAV